MLESPFSYFTDPVLRGPTLGSMLMCLAAALVGVIIFLRKQSLIGEALSHAAYPGVIIGVIAAGALSWNESIDAGLAICILVGAFFTSLAGLWTINFLVRKLKIRSDSALCFVLSAFFGIGLTLASEVQFSYSSLYRQALSYLYGQAATMTDIHIYIYGGLALAIAAMVLLLDKELQVMTFNPEFAKSIGINTSGINFIVFLLTVLAVVIGIRSVGVVLMSAMLIAPAVAARQFTNKFHNMLFLSAFFGVMSGYLGNYLSIELSHFLTMQYPNTRLALPTGPMIVLVASIICFFSLMFAPERGLVLRLGRISLFRYQCTCENVLKAFWRDSQNDMDFAQVAKEQGGSRFYLKFILMRLVQDGWLIKTDAGKYRLTKDGKQRAAQIVRLHRLWEVYLADYLGVGVEKVHRNAEEMEHILTPELERELTLLLKDPQVDPHDQRIPPKEGL
jgi:manganese/zinc/iron transport system permease protein